VTVNEGSIVNYFFGLGLVFVMAFTLLSKLLKPLSEEERRMEPLEAAVINMDPQKDKSEMPVPFWLFDKKTGRMMLVEKVTVGPPSNDPEENGHKDKAKHSKRKRKNDKPEPKIHKRDIFYVNNKESIYGRRLVREEYIGSKFENRGLNIHGN